MKRWAVFAIGALMATSSSAADWRDKAVADFKKNEPKVVDAMFTQPISLWISVRDDGSRRDGFAEYFCVRLHQLGLPSKEFVMIKIWDAKEMARQNMVELGRAECKLD